jgi:uncharacterized protein (TIGR02301 family)
MTPISRIVIVSLALLAATAQASAQFFPFGSPDRQRPQTQTPKNPLQAQPPAAQPEPPTPYDHDLQRLSEILGALHFLRGLCNRDEGQKWRSEAQALIDAEAPAGNRHDQMVAAFNRGYRNYQQSYRTCTPAAVVVIHRYLDEGARIARDITARYAN